MLKQKEVLLFVVLCLSLYQVAEPSAEVVHVMCVNFVKGLEECKKEMNLPDTVNADFYHFWKDEHVLNNRDTGCAIMCLCNKLELISDGGLHHGNMFDFAKKHGADETVAQQLVDLIHTCERGLPAMDDHCMRVLDWAKCFKVEVKKLNWSPSPDVIAAELMAAMPAM